VALAMLGSLLFVATMLFPSPLGAVTALVAGAALAWCWCVAPLLRRRRVLAAAPPGDDRVTRLVPGR
jgi:hypothetical protein